MSTANQHRCKHMDIDDEEPCGNRAKQEYGDSYCGVHKTTYYVEKIAEITELRDRAKLEYELRIRKLHNPKSSKIMMAFVWIGSLFIAGLCGAAITYAVMS